VLIVDDHESFRQLAVRVLIRAGFEVVGEAADASSALVQAAALQPDVVLLDVMLPDRSGVEIADTLLGAANPPQIVLTSSRERSDFGLGMTWPGGCAFLPKHELSGSSLRHALEER
jgi:DNA-binding NarL/FixJ family response regulator